MSNPAPRLPFYAKFGWVLLSLCLIISILYIGSSIIMPLLLALLFAILLRPVVVFLNKRLRFPHVIAVFMGVVLFVFFIGSIIFFISWQVSDFANDLPTIKRNLAAHYENVQQWVKQKFNISYNRQEKYIEQLTEDSIDESKGMVGDTLATFSETLLHIVLVPVYTFLILLYRNLFKKFLERLVGSTNQPTLLSILSEIKIVIQSYIVGLLIEMGIVSILCTTGFMIIGVPYAILLGVVTAVLNLIPYIGILVAGVIASVAALINSPDMSVVLGVVVVISIVQLIDNNFLVPKIVASKVKVNALVSIVGVFIGGAVAGTTGMFLAIPLIAIIKTVFDRIDGLKPWGFLMGDEMPTTYTWRKVKLPALDAGQETAPEEEGVEKPPPFKKE